MPRSDSLNKRTAGANSSATAAVPLGLAHGVRLKSPVAEGETLTLAQVEIDPADPTAAFRREMEAAFAPG